MIMLDLPDPPTANLYWRSFRGRIVKSPEARQYQETVRELTAASVQPLLGDVQVRLTWYRRHRRGDLDNKLKVVLDALKGVAFQDDAQIAQLVAERIDRPGQPSTIRLEVRAILPGDPNGGAIS